MTMLREKQVLYVPGVRMYVTEDNNPLVSKLVDDDPDARARGERVGKLQNVRLVKTSSIAHLITLYQDGRPPIVIDTESFVVGSSRDISGLNLSTFGDDLKFSQQPKYPQVLRPGSVSAPGTAATDITGLSVTLNVGTSGNPIMAVFSTTYNSGSFTHDSVSDSAHSYSWASVWKISDGDRISLSCWLGTGGSGTGNTTITLVTSDDGSQLRFANGATEVAGIDNVAVDTQTGTGSASTASLTLTGLTTSEDRSYAAVAARQQDTAGGVTPGTTPTETEMWDLDSGTGGNRHGCQGQYGGLGESAGPDWANLNTVSNVFGATIMDSGSAGGANTRRYGLTVAGVG